MIQITGIPKVNPYHRKPIIADFTVCPGCRQTYQPAYRLAVCPHPIISPARLFPVDTQIAIRHRNRPKTGPRPPLVLEEPFYFLQIGEDPLRHEGLQIYLQGGPGYTLTAVAKKWQKHYSFVRKVRDEDKWEIRRHAYFREQEVLKQIETQKIIKKDTADMLKVVRGSLRLCSLEVAKLLKAAESGKGQAMTHSELDKKIETHVKLYRLLQEQSTEIIKHEAPEIVRERQLRDAVTLIQDSVEEQRKAGIDDEKIQDLQSRWITIASVKFDFPRDELDAAVTGMIVHQGDSAS